MTKPLIILPSMQIAELEARIAEKDSQLMADKTTLAEMNSVLAEKNLFRLKKIPKSPLSARNLQLSVLPKCLYTENGRLTDLETPAACPQNLFPYLSPCLFLFV